jgi:hypothetical protein
MSHKIGRDQHVAPVHQGQDRSIDHAAIVMSYRAQTHRLGSQNAT